MTVRTCGSLPLRDLQDVHEGLRADALQAVKPNGSTHALEPQTPRVYGPRLSSTGNPLVFKSSKRTYVGPGSADYLQS